MNSKSEASIASVPELNQSISGSAMDRRIEKKSIGPLKVVGVLVISLVVGVGGWLLFDRGAQRSLSLNQNQINSAIVETGTFEDFIPIRGRITPKRTVYLDAIEGGRVDRRVVEDGALVEAGDLLVVLSNTTMQLDVTRNEAMVTEQLNNMRTIELQLEQNRLAHKRNLVEIDYQIQRLQRRLERLTDLDDAGVAIKSQLEDTQDELSYFLSRKAVTLESQSTDARMQETQLEFLQVSGQQLEGNLELVRRNLDSLNVRAPIDGKISGLDVEQGQSIQRGGRLGQIDDPDNFKMTAYIDEFYLSRVEVNQPAYLENGNENGALKVSKIYPHVNNGQFQVDLVFVDAQPTGLQRGQTLQGKLTLGDTSDALLIPNGPFFQETGGRWLFVMSDDLSSAVRREVRLGRRNSRDIEVLEGLQKGERIVVSSYANFEGMERLTLN